MGTAGKQTLSLYIKARGGAEMSKGCRAWSSEGEHHGVFSFTGNKEGLCVERETQKVTSSGGDKTSTRHTGPSVCAQASRRAQTIVKAQVRDVGLQRGG